MGLAARKSYALTETMPAGRNRGRFSRNKWKIILDKLNFVKYFLITFSGYEVEILFSRQTKREEI